MSRKVTNWKKIKFRICTKCHKKLSIKHFYWSRNIPFSWCKTCEKKRVLKWRLKNKTRALLYHKISWNRCREEILKAYGNRCKCCGETQSKFLVVDHVYNDGKLHRQQLGGKMFYYWLRQHNFPKRRFQLLCYNCNMAKSFYGICPHKRKKK